MLDLSEVAKAGLLDNIEGLNEPAKIFSEVSSISRNGLVITAWVLMCVMYPSRA